MECELSDILSRRETNLFRLPSTPGKEEEEIKINQENCSEEVASFARSLLLTELKAFGLPELTIATKTLDGVYEELFDEMAQEQSALQK